MLDESLIQTLVLLALVGAFAIYLKRVDQRTKLMNIKLGRLSVTFMKIENDINALHRSLVLLSRTVDDETQKEITKQYQLRGVTLRSKLSDLPSSEEVLRGLEFPDLDEDPVFWDGNLADKLNLPNSLSDATGDEIK